MRYVLGAREVQLARRQYPRCIEQRGLDGNEEEKRRGRLRTAPLSIDRRETDVSRLSGQILRKEVIQPQVPLRLPCYDFGPVADPTVAGCLPCGLAHRLRVKPTPMP